jgi:Ca2+-binding RTX toxin-like protein
MPLIVNTDRNVTQIVTDSLWLLEGVTIISSDPISPAIGNRVGLGTPNLNTLVRIDGWAIGIDDPAVFLQQGGGAANHDLVIGATGHALSGKGPVAVWVEGIGSTITNWGEISGGGGIQVFEFGFGTIENHGTVSGMSYFGIRVLQSTGVAIVNTGSIVGPAGIEIDNADVQIQNTGTIAASNPQEAALWAHLGLARFSLVNFGDIIGDIQVEGDLAFSDTVINKGRISGFISMGGGSDTYRGVHGILEGGVFGWGGDDFFAAGADDDALYGGTGRDTLRGGDGTDELYGGASNDILSGQAGDDFLFGEAGNDTLRGGPGDDALSGGKDADTFILTLDPGHDLVQDFRDGTDRLSLAPLHLASATAALNLASDRPGGVLFDLRSLGGGTVFLEDVTKAQLSAADLIV